MKIQILTHPHLMQFLNYLHFFLLNIIEINIIYLQQTVFFLIMRVFLEETFM